MKEKENKNLDKEIILKNIEEMNIKFQDNIIKEINDKYKELESKINKIIVILGNIYNDDDKNKKNNLIIKQENEKKEITIDLNKKIEEQNILINEQKDKIDIYEKENSKYKNKINEYNNIINKYKLENEKINSQLKENKDKKKQKEKFELEKDSIREEIEKKLKEKYDNDIKLEINKYNNLLNKKKIEFEELNKKYNQILNLKKEEKKEFSKNKEIHNNIKCEKCFQEPIIGNRYKCSVCNNYNLCEECEEKNSISDDHPHDFIKIRKNQKDNMKVTILNNNINNFNDDDNILNEINKDDNIINEDNTIIVKIILMKMIIIRL